MDEGDDITWSVVNLTSKSACNEPDSHAKELQHDQSHQRSISLQKNSCYCSATDSILIKLNLLMYATATLNQKFKP